MGSTHLTMWWDGSIFISSCLVFVTVTLAESFPVERREREMGVEDVLDLVDENISPVEDEYDGMMGALADIQNKGDSMLAGIRWQKEMLDKLEKNLENTEKKMKEAEMKTQQLEEEKVDIESEVWELQVKKKDLLLEMKTEQEEIVRVKSDLVPLENQVE